MSLSNGVTVLYAYDAVSRVTGITYQHGATVIGDVFYTYDATGRRVRTGGSYARTGLPQAMAGALYDAASQQTAFGGAVLAYDLDGRLTSDGTLAYAWNARNQLSAITGPGVDAAFAYDGLGRRVMKTINGGSTAFVYDGITLVREIGATTANLLTGTGLDECFVRTEPGGVSVFLPDALGSTLALADGTGSIQAQYTYEPFGATTSTGTSGNALQFTGRENDGTGLYYFRARYYHPALRRFISQDPAALAGGNPYTYAANTPLNAVDPLGLLAIIMQGGPASSGPGGSSFSGPNRGLENLARALETRREPVKVLNSGQVQEAIRLATQAQAAGEPVYIIGHSLGGAAGIDAALQLPQAPTHLYTIDPFLPHQNIPDGIPTTNFVQRDGPPFGSLLNGPSVENLRIEDLSFFGGHFDITNDPRVRDEILRGIPGNPPPDCGRKC